MTTYSRRLGEVLTTASSVQHDVYTVPAGKVAVVRSITAYVDVGPSTAIWFRVGGRVYAFHHLAGQGDDDRNDLRWVLSAGEVLSFFNLTGAWQASAHGYELDA